MPGASSEHLEGDVYVALWLTLSICIVSRFTIGSSDVRRPLSAQVQLDLTTMVRPTWAGRLGHT